MSHKRIYQVDEKVPAGLFLPLSIQHTFAMFGASGIRLLVDSKVDYSKSKNLILTSIVFTTGLSGLSIKFGEIEFKGMVLASLVAVALSLIFFIFEKLGVPEE